jgi:hypothetical protein
VIPGGKPFRLDQDRDVLVRPDTKHRVPSLWLHPHPLVVLRDLPIEAKNQIAFSEWRNGFI